MGSGMSGGLMAGRRGRGILFGLRRWGWMLGGGNEWYELGEAWW